MMNRAERMRRFRFREIYRAEKKIMGLRDGDLVERHNMAISHVLERKGGRRMKSKLAEAINTIRQHCKSNHYRCIVCPLHGGGKCGLATEPHKWKAAEVRASGGGTKNGKPQGV